LQIRAKQSILLLMIYLVVFIVCGAGMEFLIYAVLQTTSQHPPNGHLDAEERECYPPLLYHPF